jgi:hypothetical protein
MLPPGRQGQALRAKNAGRVCGHADSSVGAGYEHGDSVEVKKAAIEKLRYDGFVLAA